MFTSAPKRFTDLLSHLKLYDDCKLPFMIRDKNILAFENCILFLDTLECLPYTDAAAQDKIARNYIKKPYHGTTNTPLFDNFLMYQLDSGDTEQDQEVFEVILALIGRAFFKTNEHDCWHVALLLYGESRTGKTTLLNIIRAMFGIHEKGVISANQEKTFGLDSLAPTDVIFVPNMPDNFKDVIDQSMFQNLVDGDDVNIAGKHKAAYPGRIRAPIFMAGNVFPNYPDKKGAIVNRIPIVKFDKFVKNKDSLLEDRIIDNELPDLILKCLTAYWKLASKHKGQDFWSFAPQYFHDNKEYARTATNWLHKFLTSSPDDNKSLTTKYYVRQKKRTGDARLMIPIGDVRKAFEHYMKFNFPLERIRWDETDHATFKALGYDVSEINICKSCAKKAKGGKDKCCDDYSAANRAKRIFVYDMDLVKETIAVK
ncbi:hypothetical protein HDU89_001147, partial [Geranomyces variabilis]